MPCGEVGKVSPRHRLVTKVRKEAHRQHWRMVAFPRHRKWRKKGGQMQEGAIAVWVGCSTEV